MKQKLFHHPPTVSALTLTAKSIGTYGLTLPQRYTAPMFPVWNVTEACNLTCKHCYQNARHKPAADELTTDEKLNLIDQMGEEYVPFVAFAGGEPLVTRDLWKVLEHCQPPRPPRHSGHQWHHVDAGDVRAFEGREGKVRRGESG